MIEYQLFINGAWRNGGNSQTLPVINPATEKAIGRVASATVGDLDDSLEAARSAFTTWSNLPAIERGRLLIKAAELLSDRIESAARALSLEQGKTVNEARGEFARAVETFRWNGEHGHTLCAPLPLDADREIVPESLGVVAAFTPWNYPAILTARKLAAPLAAGCTVILKAAEETPGASVTIVQALTDAGIPAGVVNLVFGNPSNISSHLLGSSIVKVLTFTGSTAVGKQLAALAASNLQRCVLELGGHSPVVVFADADIDKAVHAIVDYKFECAGQSCNAPSRIYVAENIYNRFVARMIEVTQQIKVGSSDDVLTQMGPMANLRRIEAMERLMADAISRGAKVELGGSRLDRPGFFWPPTILTNVNPKSLILSEEPFGPVLPIMAFADVDDAIQQSNSTVYGLASYFFTNSDEIKKLMVSRLAAGSVGVNQLKGVSADAPNAGINDSGYGFEGGAEGFRAFQNLKLINGTAELRPSA